MIQIFNIAKEQFIYLSFPFYADKLQEQHSGLNQY